MVKAEHLIAGVKNYRPKGVLNVGAETTLDSSSGGGAVVGGSGSEQLVSGGLSSSSGFLNKVDE